MANTSGNAYALTALIPIRQGQENNIAYDKCVRDQLSQWGVNENSPMAGVPNTYLCRFYLLNDVFYQGSPAEEEHLKNKYIVFNTNFYGDLEDYLKGMWDAAQASLKPLLDYCVAFDQVTTGEDFVDYIKRCQLDVNLFFNGSNDKSLDEQLKALLIKQSMSHFAFMTQPFQVQGELGARRLQHAFQQLQDYIKPLEPGPAWPVAASQAPADLESDIQKIVDATIQAIQ